MEEDKRVRVKEEEERGERKMTDETHESRVDKIHVMVNV